MMRRLAAVTLCAGLAGLSACSATASNPQQSPQQDVRKAAVPARTADVADPGFHDALDLGGRHRVEMVTHNGGTVTWARGKNGMHWMKFPGYIPTDPPSAALTVWPVAGATDALNPGSQDFSFGARFRIDSPSWGSPTDNGDNLMQRGLFVGKAQYKLQIDKDYPSCRIAGTKGSVLVKGRRIHPDQTYAVRCTRTGDRVTLVVTRFADGVTAAVHKYSGEGPIGALDIPSAIPLSIGAKVLKDGEIAASSTDQFNGSIGAVFVHVSN